MQKMQSMHDFTSTNTSQGEGVRAATTLLINVRCCNNIAHQRALLYRYLPYQFGYGLHMQINGKSANANVAMYALHELHNSTIEP
jgi:hypothetical protein